MTTTLPPSPAPSTGATSSGSPSPRATAPELAAIFAALAGEHAAVYAYGVVGGQVGPSSQRAARERLAWHGLQRDLLSARLSADGTVPPVANPAYALPFWVRSVVDARRLAAHVEQSLAATYADLVFAAAPGRRGEAAGWLAQCAVQARRWGGAAQAFPGLPERD